MTAVHEQQTEAPVDEPVVASGDANTQPSRRTRLRTRATRPREAIVAACTRLVAWWTSRQAPTEAERAAPSIRRTSIWAQPLPTVRDLLTAVRAGLMVPGDWPRPVELAGKVYGYGFALPVTLLSYGVAWTAQKPSHLAGVALFVTLLAVSL